MKSSHTGQVQVYVMPPNEGYSEKWSAAIPVQEGEVQLFLCIPDQLARIDGIRIDPPEAAEVKLKRLTLMGE
ncbi:hypothetical protein Q5741_17535 [Paenibacillus sp. JX-17]|uniref:Uncharacterized protein n=1 Tax=Paenibacillus lacisoli TaxID=3064525 RepID=A0ABT9CG01_9BACL|nr:hypothetical protein [Paenibacillus sp. JX-17]MDO7908208.1 hypothetical protein [Paenibacillus sp. JX-17]